MTRTNLVSAVAVLLVASVACGETTVWNPASNGIYPPDTGNWNDQWNWTKGVVPSDVDKVVFNVPEAAEAIVNDEQTIGNFVQGDNGPGGVIRIQSGGSITTATEGEWSAVGYNDAAHMIVETGGSLTTAARMFVGRLGESTLDINGGTVTTLGDGDLDFGNEGGTGIVNINGGVLTTARDVDFNGGMGTVNVNDGGELNARRLDWAGGIGQVNVNAGGTVNINQLYNDGEMFVADSGQVTTEVNWSAVGRKGTGTLTVEGTVDFGQHLWVGKDAGSTGTVDINGGTVSVAEMIGLGWSGGDGFVNVNDGGLLTLANIHGDGSSSIKQNSLLSINGTGLVTLVGDRVGTIETYASSGLIAGNGVIGEVTAIWDEVADITRVTAGLSVAVNGDYNDNGLVEQGDLDLVLLNWGSEIPPDTVPEGWVNQPPTDDGKIDQNDLDGVLLNWGNSAVASATASAVPEPGTMSLVLASACVLLGLGRRRGA